MVSVIIPVLNGAASLRQCLRSIRAQNYPNLEVIVLDGGSTDGTVGILRENDDLVSRWISEPDGGVYEAMNKGVQLSSGDWIYFLGSDDILLDGFSRIIKSLRDPNTIYYGDVFMPLRNRRYDGRFSAYKLASRNICHQSMFYPAMVWDRYAFEPRYSGLADHVLNMRCFGDPNIRFEYIPETVARFEDSRGISQVRKDTLFDEDRLRLVRENFSTSVYYLNVARTLLLNLLKRVGLYGVLWRIKVRVMRVIRPG